MDFVSGSNIDIKKCSAQQEQIHWALHVELIARSTCTSSLSLFRYTWVLITALRNCVVARFSFYCDGDKLHVPLTTFPQEKFVERKLAKESKSSQIKILEPSASQKSQISGFWLQKSQSGNPGSE